jgi:hypothetical protein
MFPGNSLAGRPCQQQSSVWLRSISAPRPFIHPHQQVLAPLPRGVSEHNISCLSWRMDWGCWSKEDKRRKKQKAREKEKKRRQTLKMEPIRSSETFITTYKTTRRHNSEDHNPHITAVRTSNLRRQILEGGGLTITKNVAPYFSTNPWKRMGACRWVFSFTLRSLYPMMQVGLHRPWANCMRITKWKGDNEASWDYLDKIFLPSGKTAGALNKPRVAMQWLAELLFRTGDSWARMWANTRDTWLRFFVDFVSNSSRTLR